MRSIKQYLAEARTAKDFVTRKGRKVKYGSDQHIRELEDTLERLMHAREGQRKGSAGRTDMSRAVGRVRGELRKACRARDRRQEREENG